jgi:hypothetical protein
VRQPEKKDAPAEPRVRTLKRRKLPRMVGGTTDKLPDVAVITTVVKSCQLPHAELLVESENWTSYPVMALLRPPAAPDHDRVVFPSAIVGLTEALVGAVATVVLCVHSMVSRIWERLLRPVNDI